MGRRNAARLCTALGVLGLLLASEMQAQQIVELAAFQKAKREPAVQDAARRLAVISARNAVDELTTALERIERESPFGGPADEWLLDLGLHELAKLEPTGAARRFVAALEDRRPTVFVRVDPDHGSHAAPLLDIGATARFVVRSWERAAARKRALSELQEGSSAPFTRFAQREAPLDAVKGGVAEALQAAPVQVLLRHRDALAQLLEEGAAVDDLGVIAARRLADADLYRLVMTHGGPVATLKAVGEVGEVLAPDEALRALQAASTRSDVGSAAIMQIGAVAAVEARARTVLFQLLDDAHSGPSAAAALARTADARVLNELGERLMGEKSHSARMHAALALKLNGSPGARAQLERFSQTGEGSAKLRRDVRQWLAQ